MSKFGNTETYTGCAFKHAYKTLCERIPHYSTVDEKEVIEQIKFEGQRFCDTLGDQVQYLNTITVLDFEVIFTCHNPKAEEVVYNALKDEGFMTVVKMEKGICLKYQQSSCEPEEIKNIIAHDGNHRIIFGFLVAVFETLGCKTIW